MRQFEAQVAVPAATLAQTERLRAQQEHELSLLLGGGADHGGPRRHAGRGRERGDGARLAPGGPAGAAARRAAGGARLRGGDRADRRRAGRPVPDDLGQRVLRLAGAERRRVSSARDREIYQALAGVSFPLFTGGRLVNQTRAAEARAEQARAQYEQSVLVALREASDALVGVRTARDEVAAQATQAHALRRALQLADLRYRTGIASYLEVLDAQRGLFDAELALSQAQLRQLIGGGGAVSGARWELAGGGDERTALRSSVARSELDGHAPTDQLIVLAHADVEGPVDVVVPRPAARRTAAPRSRPSRRSGDRSRTSARFRRSSRAPGPGGR